MDIKSVVVENWLSNFCFVLLFFTTLYYWIKVIFFVNVESKNFGLIGLGAANLVITVQLLLRWGNSGHFPLSNLYESLLFLAWGLLFFYTIIELQTKLEVLGVLISPVILCIATFTTFSLPAELQQSKALVPALQSNWLVMHVSVMMLSYASLVLGCILSLGYLIIDFFFKKQNTDFRIPLEQANSLPEFKIQSVPKGVYCESQTFQKSSLLPLLDSLGYRTLSIGFCFLTVGILSGAVWANETWGTYWSWDPKETWAFITWLTFAIYLHTRLIQGWQGSKPAWIASFGFVIIWICYLGVNLVGKGLHSYGFVIS